ncbi:hypothetical protein L2E82_52940 [Cichorium intybus]|nr:hypothetical protein L2E82_52940 [Cichorium intybus]
MTPSFPHLRHLASTALSPTATTTLSPTPPLPRTLLLYLGIDGNLYSDNTQPIFIKTLAGDWIASAYILPPLAPLSLLMTPLLSLLPTLYTIMDCLLLPLASFLPDHKRLKT